MPRCVYLSCAQSSSDLQIHTRTMTGNNANNNTKTITCLYMSSQCYEIVANINRFTACSTRLCQHYDHFSKQRSLRHRLIFDLLENVSFWQCVVGNFSWNPCGQYWCCMRYTRSLMLTILFLSVSIGKKLYHCVFVLKFFCVSYFTGCNCAAT